MTRRSYLCGGSMLAVVLSLGVAASAAAQTSEPAEVEEVVVTGSFIAGTPEDAALPVDVIGAAELERQGAPSVVQLVKTITAAQSSLGESNRYNGGAGTASINLRGLGASRTLVLMNGRRLADTTAAAFQGGGQDLNFIPTAAVGRIEILKDGAAATYGSDAVAGVVNFITRKDLNGLEVDANYALIDGSDGDYDLDVAYGRMFDAGNILMTAGYRHRSRLDIRDRDWALKPFESVFYGGWSGSANPGIYLQPNGGAPSFQDNGCNELGGQLLTPTFRPVGSAAAGGTQCRFQFTPFNDLVNEENQYQLYGEVNYDLTDTLSFHGEVAWHRIDTPDQRISPANLTTQFPTPISAGGTSGSTAPAGFNGQSRFFIPASNPGLVNLRTVCAAPLTATQCASMVNGVTASQTGWRAIGVAGHPTNSDKADHQDIERTAFRISGGLKGELAFGIGWDAAVTYMENKGTVVTNDLLVNRIQNAFRGLGGPGCNPTTGAPGVGACQYFNPFTNAIQVSGANGASNPYYQPSVANDPALVEWLYGTYTNVNTNSILVGDLVFNGDTGIELGGGSIRWAAGAQYRFTETTSDWEGLGDVRATPCVDSIDDGLPLCSNPVGPFVFFGAQEDFNADRRAWAVFGEMLVPILDNLEVTLAVRHENFGGNVGTTTDPKISGRWQALDWLAFRASAGSTFRAPSEGQTSPGTSKGVSNIGGSYRAVVTANNPDLKPETADTYNIGVIVQFGGFSGSVDYYNFDFEGELGIEDTTGLFNALAQTGANRGCNNAALVARFVFTNAGCGQANVLQLTRRVVNGPRTKTAGFDIRAQYEFDNFFGLDFMETKTTVGAEATLVDKVKRGEASLGEDPSVIFAPAVNRAGLHDLGGGDFYSFPKTRINAFVNVRGETWNLRYQMLYREGTRNVGAACTGAFPNYVQTPDCRFNYQTNAYESVGKTKAYWQHDLNANVELPWDTTVSASILNVFDKDPPFAQSFYNYDLTNGNPLGRVFKLGVKKRF